MKSKIVKILADAGLTIGEASDLLRDLSSEIMAPVYDVADLEKKRKLVHTELED